jgi:hypothetical protein
MLALKKLHDQKSHCDIVLMVGATPFPAHRIMLYARSDFFAKCLEGQMGDPKIELDLPSVCPDTFPEFLEFLYTDIFPSHLRQNPALFIKFIVLLNYFLMDAKECLTQFMSIKTITNMQLLSVVSQCLDGGLNEIQLRPIMLASLETRLGDKKISKDELRNLLQATEKLSLFESLSEHIRSAVSRTDLTISDIIGLHSDVAEQDAPKDLAAEVKAQEIPALNSSTVFSLLNLLPFKPIETMEAVARWWPHGHEPDHKFCMEDILSRSVGLLNFSQLVDIDENKLIQLPNLKEVITLEYLRIRKRCLLNESVLRISKFHSLSSQTSSGPSWTIRRISPETLQTEYDTVWIPGTVIEESWKWYRFSVLGVDVKNKFFQRVFVGASSKTSFQAAAKNEIYTRTGTSLFYTHLKSDGFVVYCGGKNKFFPRGKFVDELLTPRFRDRVQLYVCARLVGHTVQVGYNMDGGTDVSLTQFSMSSSDSASMTVALKSCANYVTCEPMMMQDPICTESSQLLFG